MINMKVLVAYDGTLQSKDALRYGVQKVRENGGEVIAFHVFPYGMFIDYDATPRAAETARAETARHLKDARRFLDEEAKDIRSRIISEEGDPGEEIIAYATASNIDVLLCPPRYKGVARKFKKILEESGKEITEDEVWDESERLKMAVCRCR
jgi:nucleotide-binding universal stress UspA family protein